MEKRPKGPIPPPMPEGLCDIALELIIKLAV
ncbi:MAG: hypothetical protein JWN85_3468 [Gammaproteobacteria bacterium]|nr:hypothetical protein [Gammaproteobacteria bacterium]